MFNICIGICTYNRSEILSDLLKRLRGVSIAKIIVCNDASKDDTVKVLELERKLNGKLKYFSNTGNLGVTGSRNEIFKRVKDDIDLLILLDDDDMLTSDAVDKINFHVKHGIADIYMFAALDDTGQYASKSSVGFTAYSHKQYIEHQLKGFGPGILILKRSVLSKMGNYDVNRVSDGVMTLDAMRLGAIFSYIPVPIKFHRSVAENRLSENIKTCKEYKKLLKGRVYIFLRHESRYMKFLLPSLYRIFRVFALLLVYCFKDFFKGEKCETV